MIKKNQINSFLNLAESNLTPNTLQIAVENFNKAIDLLIKNNIGLEAYGLEKLKEGLTQNQIKRNIDYLKKLVE